MSRKNAFVFNISRRFVKHVNRQLQFYALPSIKININNRLQTPFGITIFLLRERVLVYASFFPNTLVQFCCLLSSTLLYLFLVSLFYHNVLVCNLITRCCIYIFRTDNRQLNTRSLPIQSIFIRVSHSFTMTIRLDIS